MKQVAYTIIIIAGLMFISDWAYRNYVSYEWAQEGVTNVSASLNQDRYKSKFEECEVRWPSSPLIRASCDAQSASGYRLFNDAWNKPDISTQRMAAMIGCWRGGQSAGGTDWMIAGNCAAVTR